MSPHLFSAIKLIHFLAMAVWIGAALTLPSDVKRTIAQGRPHTDALEARIARSLTIGSAGGLLTILSGLGLIVALGGFGSIRVGIHIGLTLAVAALGVESFGLRSAIALLKTQLATGDARSTVGATRKIAMFTGISHALKLVILVLMVFRF